MTAAAIPNRPRSASPRCFARRAGVEEIGAHRGRQAQAEHHVVQGQRPLQGRHLGQARFGLDGHLEDLAQALDYIAATPAIREVVLTGGDPLTLSSRRLAEVIGRLASVLDRCSGARIEVGGYTDSQGREETNLRISRERAEAVKAELIRSGAAAESLTAMGYGEESPIADNGTAAGRAKNRRIEFSVSP